MGLHVSIMDLPTGKRKRKLKFSDVHEVTANLNILQAYVFALLGSLLPLNKVHVYTQENALLV